MPALSQSDRQRDDGGGRRRYGTIRQFVEFLVCLLIAVALCRTFAVESYMIETGSMAPGLYGWHVRMRCTSCRYPFAVGIDDEQRREGAVCPNCRQGVEEISTAASDSQPEAPAKVIGDRVLVAKDRFTQRQPRRWEIAVFRNPNLLLENYVKRIVGLPGETIQIQQGNIYINGKIQRKSLRQQREMRILVYDHHFRPPPSDLQWQPRWKPARPQSRWQGDAGAFTYTPADNKHQTPEMDWVDYRHWIRGSSLETATVPLSKWPAGADPPDPFVSNLAFNAQQQTLSCRGVMTVGSRDRLLALSSDPEFHQAVEQLFEQSHISYISDRYGYNTASDDIAVREIQLALRLRRIAGDGEFAIQMTDGIKTIECRFDFGDKTIRLFESDSETPLFEEPLPEQQLANGELVEVSLVDRQALVAVGGEVIGEPWHYPMPDDAPPPPRQPVRFGAANLSVRVDSLKLFRDIHYLCKPHEAGFRPYQLGEDEFFALGDNSPISEDSRVWLSQPTPGKLTQEHFIGKPFLVHLPSKSWRGMISIPDVSRMRYIR